MEQREPLREFNDFALVDAQQEPRSADDDDEVGRQRPAPVHEAGVRVDMRREGREPLGQGGVLGV
jgi:hypothetical protein